MQKSMVVDSSTGKSKPSEVRTSTGTFFPMGYDDVVKRIDRRVAQVSMIPQGASGCGWAEVWGKDGRAWIGRVWVGPGIGEGGLGGYG